MTTKTYIQTTREWTDAEDNVIDSMAVRIHFIYRSGSAPILYGDAPHPGDDPEIEFDYIQRQNSGTLSEVLSGKSKPWVRIEASDDRRGMIPWAEDYLAKNASEAMESVEDAHQDAVEYRAEQRRDARLFE
jgi:hypothetical protein